jgi:PAS domain S-box-containing protein
MLAHATTGVAIFDRDMRYLAHNTQWLAAHGVGDTTESWVGRSHYDVLVIPEHWRAVHRRCLAGAVEKSDHDVYDPAGVRQHLRWLVAPWRSDDDAIAGIFIVSDNITARVNTERKLAERESLVHSLFEQSPIGVNLCRMDGLWLESNQAFLDIIGYTKEEADGGLTYWQLTPRKYDVEEEKQLASLRANHRYGPYEKEFVRKDGRLVPVRLNGFIVEREGEQLIWSLVEDLTARRALEARLEEERVRAIHASKLATMGEMAASFAHEINNPLGIIDAFAYVVQDALARGDTKEIAEAAEAIRSAAERATTIVRNLRRFARETGEEPLEVHAVARIVDDALGLCRTRIATAGVELSSDVDPELKVRGRIIELSQVLVNLLNNAFDAARGTAQPAIAVLAAAEADQVRIEVEDTGPGVPPERREDIFRSFFTTKPSDEGTGLGLSISRSIVERHGGTIAYEPRGDTSRFVVRLPRAT